MAAAETAEADETQAASVTPAVAAASPAADAARLAAPAAGAELQEVIRSAYEAEVTYGDDGQRGSEINPDPKRIAESMAESEQHPVRIKESGYIQYVDPAIMLTVAQDNDLVIRLLHKPGHFVATGAVVATVWPADRVDDQIDKLIRRAFQVGNVRTPTQDIECAVNQLTEMAVRAMSPAINDPFTAMTCLNHIGDGLVAFIQKGEKGSDYYDQDGRLRLVLDPVTFGELLDAAFGMLRHASCENAAVLLHMLAVIKEIGQAAKSPVARQQLLDHVSLIQAESRVGNLIEDDRQRIAQSSTAVTVLLGDAS